MLTDKDRPTAWLCPDLSEFSYWKLLTGETRGLQESEICSVSGRFSGFLVLLFFCLLFLLLHFLLLTFVLVLLALISHCVSPFFLLSSSRALENGRSTSYQVYCK